MVVPLGQAQMIVEMSHFIGIDSVADVRKHISTNSDETSAIAEQWRETQGGVSPSPPDLEVEMLRARQPGATAEVDED